MRPAHVDVARPACERKKLLAKREIPSNLPELATDLVAVGAHTAQRRSSERSGGRTEACARAEKSESTRSWTLTLAGDLVRDKERGEAIYAHKQQAKGDKVKTSRAARRPRCPCSRPLAPWSSGANASLD